MRRDWPVALTGVAFIVLLIAGLMVGGEPPTATEDSPADIVSFWVDNESSVIAGTVLVMLAALSLVFFGGYLRKVLRSPEGDGGMLPTVVVVGTTIMAVGTAIDATITVALVTAAEEIDEAAVQALQALWDNDFLPIALGIFVFLLATGLAIVRHAGLPAWLGWIAIALVVLYIAAAASDVEPIWIVASLGSALWVLTLSVLLAVRGRRATR